MKLIYLGLSTCYKYLYGLFTQIYIAENLFRDSAYDNNDSRNRDTLNLGVNCLRPLSIRVIIDILLYLLAKIAFYLSPNN